MAADERYVAAGVKALVINVLEGPDIVARWQEALWPAVPVLKDADGKVAEAYAPAGVLPALPRNQIPIASNLIIDRQGRVQFYELLDSRNFDAQLVRLRARLDQLLAAETEETP